MVHLPLISASSVVAAARPARRRRPPRRATRQRPRSPRAQASAAKNRQMPASLWQTPHSIRPRRRYSTPGPASRAATAPRAAPPASRPPRRRPPPAPPRAQAAGPPGQPASQWRPECRCRGGERPPAAKRAAIQAEAPRPRRSSRARETDRRTASTPAPPPQPGHATAPPSSPCRRPASCRQARHAWRRPPAATARACAMPSWHRTDCRPAAARGRVRRMPSASRRAPSSSDHPHRAAERCARDCGRRGRGDPSRRSRPRR